MAIATGAAPQTRTQWSALHLAALIGGNAALAVGPWFVRMTDAGPVSAAFWRLALAVPLLAGLALLGGQRLTGYRPAIWLAIVGAGLFFALDLGAWHVGIHYTRMGNATLFGNSGSVIVMAAGLIALRRWPLAREWLAFGLAIGGAAILLGRSLEIDRTTLMGDLFCLAAGILYAGYILLARGARQTLGSWALLTWSSLAGAPVLLAIALALGERIVPTAWWPIVSLAVLGQIAGQGLLVYAMRHFSAVVFGLALLTQPAVAITVGWVAFGEVLGWTDLAGMAMVAGALVLARSTQG